MKKQIVKVGLILTVFNLMGNAYANLTREEMLQKGDGGLKGMAFVRPVIKDVLYRAGFKGGDKNHTGLSSEQRQNLCNEGFSEARYIDFGTKTNYGATVCADGSQLNYQSGSSSRPDQIMKDLYQVITQEKKPMIVHCMWGVHSSGAVAAMALVQFCGWTEDEAKKYWLAAENNAPCSGGCSNWIDGKFKNFKFNPSLVIDQTIQDKICPKY